MNWYILFSTTNRDIKGRAVNQSKCITGYTFEGCLRDPSAPYLTEARFQLHHQAKLTDLVQSVMTSERSPLISQKLLENLNQFKTAPSSRALPVKLIGKKKEAYAYYILAQYPCLNATDYSRSIFCKPAGLDENYQPAYEELPTGLNSYREVIDFGGVGARALYIKKDIGWDYFVLAGPPFLWLARDYVVEALRSAQITGICYIPFMPGDDFVYDGIVEKAIRTCGS
jgi:hypothetical protein